MRRLSTELGGLGEKGFLVGVGPWAWWGFSGCRWVTIQANHSNELPRFLWTT